jgi:hypothetical protein
MTELRLTEAQKRLAIIHKQRTELVTRQSELGQRLEHVQEESGRRYLAGDRDGLEEVGKIGAELRALESAIAILDEQDREAQISVKRARAHDLRNEASGKRAELEELNAATAVVRGHYQFTSPSHHCGLRCLA